jgi:hypothetical protein
MPCRFGGWSFTDASVPGAVATNSPSAMSAARRRHGVFHWRQRAARSRNRTQRVSAISTSGVSQDMNLESDKRLNFQSRLDFASDYNAADAMAGLLPLAEDFPPEGEASSANLQANDSNLISRISFTPPVPSTKRNE